MIGLVALSFHKHQTYPGTDLTELLRTQNAVDVNY